MASRIRTRASDPFPALTLLDAINDEALFKPWFEKNPASWSGWIAFICALFALPMTREQVSIFRKCTGRKRPPSGVARTAVLICGRRAGKSFTVALIAVFLAAFYDYAPYLARGERGTVMIIASDRRQARTILRYMRALLSEVPLLRKMIARETAEGFDLNNRISIEISTASMKSVRGYTVVAGILDEAAFFSTDEGSASPDAEIVKAIKPAMSTIPNAMLLVASSPYAKRGILWDAHKEHFGKEGGDTLVWQADTRTMNPTVPQREIDAAYASDPASASAEFGAQFRNDVETFISLEAVLACVSEGVFERPRESGVKYSAFLDPAGGSGKDAFAMAIGHFDKKSKMAVVDCIREARPPFSPEATTAAFVATLKSYGVSKVLGDRFAGEWVREPLRKLGITYDPSSKPKSELYLNTLPLLNSQKVDLIDHKKLVQQFVGLEMRTSRAGKPSIDHAPGANSHDDVCNVVSGLVAHIGTSPYRYVSDLSWVSNETDTEEAAAFLAGRRYRHIFSGGGFMR